MKINYTLSTSTLSLIEEMKKCANNQQDALIKNVKHDKYVELSVLASKALSTANKSHQTDIFDAILKTENPLVTLCEVGTYEADGFTVDKKKGLNFIKVETALSLSAFIAYANSKGVLSLGASYQGDVYSAVKFAAIQTAGEMNIAPDTYVKRLNLTDSDRAAVVNPFSGVVSASRSTVKHAMQVAVNSIFGTDDKGKARYWVNAEDVRALSQLFNCNRVKLSIVVPLESTMLDMFFFVLRHIVGGMEYSMDVKESKKENKKAQ